MKKKSYTAVTKLTVPSNTLFLETALGFIENSAKVFNFEEQEIFQIKVAAEEAISNIMKHAFSNDIRESFEIRCFFESTEFKIVLHEKGKPFVAEKIVEYNPKNMTLNSDAKGLGTFLMQKYMDVVEYKNMGREGKETLLVKYPKSQRFDSILSMLEKPKGKITDFTYILRRFEDDDALGISECAYSAYGYTYEPYIYYPSKIVALNREKRMRSFVAQSDSGEIIAHIALKYENNPSVAEIGVAFVKKEYRGQSVFTSLTDYLFEESECISNLKCIFGKAVTSHPISQNVLFERGATPIAITLSLFPSDVDFKDLRGEVTQKDAALLIALNINHDSEQRELYVPKKHQTIISKIFKSLQYPIVLKEAAGVDEDKKENTKIEYKIIDIFNAGEIYCFDYTYESAQKIHAVLQTLCLNRVDVVYLYLDLEDERLVSLSKECEAMGFFFAGVLPFGINGHHALIYQYLNNLDFNFDTMQITNSDANELKEYVQKSYNASRI